jgi:outer membrane lipoprotein-sorting protein
MRRRGLILIFIACVAFVIAFSTHAQKPRSPSKPATPSASGNILERSRATYAALQSYSDTGTITTEDILPGAPAIVEHHTFATAYRAPRQYYFDFKKDPEAGDERFVIWCERDDFNTWWSATGVHEKYEKGRGEFAFATASEPTKGSAMLISPLLFSKANLQGPLLNLKDEKDVGTEDVGGRSCHKITARMVLTYSDSGQTAEERSVIVWIDAETLLVRKVFEDTPRGSMEGSASRITTIFDPQANPNLDDARFRFAIPKG